LTASHTSQISSNDTDILALQSRLNLEEPKISALQTLTTSHTSQINSKQSQITDQTNILCKDIEADNIILRVPSLFEDDIDITKGSISCTSLTVGTVSALYKISTLASISAGTTLTVNSVEVGAKLVSLESKINSNTTNISFNTSTISGVAASVATLNSTVYGFGVFPFATPGLVSVVAANTTSIVGLSSSIGSANGRIDDNENDISSLNSNKQNNIDNTIDVICRDIICDNITMNSPDVNDVNKGYLNATTKITSNLTLNGVNVSDKITNFEERITSNTSALNTKQNTLIAGDNILIDVITNTISAIGEVTQAELTTALDTKQNTLIAGDNITIDEITNTISAIGEVTQSKLTLALDTKQNTLIAGDNITIDEITNTISAIGEVTQSELTTALDTKQNTLIAGDNITIDEITNTI
jgi:sorbitol-specific phosphotransferase system component IIA